ncbi:DHH family phosphoesterase [Undibacterium griseum]|uniref:Acetyltransferase n=1 Tax=Undibacterium griseum TaxID=2762295 RepID=A0ABR6YM48_9BURK|nr:DHH family phosphoesterase [Undibacterium griseum]MBC3884972.1 acetyltransferase [Undibacterium griseum]
MIAEHQTQPRCFDIFNGDADGICALHQLRLAFPAETILVTGVKRDITLLDRVDAKAGDKLTVLDISLDANIEPLKKHLAAGAEVLYFDHHTAKQIFHHTHLTWNWSEAHDVCTSILVNRYLQGRFVKWAIAAAYGDNLIATADIIAAGQHLTQLQRLNLQELGKLINFNAYGEHVSDLHIHPAALYREIQQYADPFDFIWHSSHFLALQYAYAEDFSHIDHLRPVQTGKASQIYLLPEEPWARRLSGVFANQLSEQHPDLSFAVLTPKATGGFVVSVRSADPERKPASHFCEMFPGGGGRRLAAGINYLELQDADAFFAAFFNYFESPDVH